MAFRILWAINMPPAAVFAYFFVAGLADASISSSNIGLWLGVFLVWFAILCGSVALHRARRAALAHLVLAQGAIGAVLAALFLMMVMGSGGRWN
ncbi:hypothetical protein ACXIUS_24135 [Bosea thiooxidans]|nr:hypothetical protein [Bosea sp. (in: a-proteobacteria)]